jgi:hypothetical protein
MALVAAGTLLAPSPARAAEAPAPAATIIEVSGPVTWHPGGETAFKDARVGDLLHAGAVVRTGVRGNARLKWRNGGDFRLLPLSELAVPDDEGVLVNAGKVWAQFQQKLLAPFYFKSPSATAVVRGTILGVSLNPDASTTVEVLEGRVEVTSARGGASRMLEPGQSLIVSPFGGLGPIQPVDPAMRLFEQGAPTPDPGRPGPGREPGMRPDRGPDGGMRPDRGPDAGMRPDRGPDPGMRQSGPRPDAAEWLRNNRAAVRLETMRQEERSRRELRFQQTPPDQRPEQRQGPQGQQHRGPRGFGLRPRSGDPTDRQPMTADPNAAFPGGRLHGPGGPLPLYCDPATMQPLQPGVMPECPPPPPPPGAPVMPPPPGVQP